MKNSSIAIVGMAGRFPGARDIVEFWRNLEIGVESIRRLSETDLLAAGATAEEITNPEYVRAAAILSDVEMFDAAFFGFSPKDAAIMDPQHRHFLECAWEALEHSGHTSENFPGAIGVYAGSGMNSYLIHNLLSNRKLVESTGLFLLKQTGNDKDVLATRVSYQLNLRGPSINVQTACSTSLVAVHLACQSLLNFECDMALAGGVTIEIPHGQGYLYREGEILSRDGHCRPFDAAANGTVFSSGAGIVALRRLEDALADHDTIHAVILGSAINNDGARKVGYLAPSVEGQAEVVAEALGVAGIEADAVSYVETHGTGTVVGDPIEIKALTQAFRQSSQRRNFCGIGSLKSSVGHMDAAAGVAGLIKTVLALEHRKLPASLNFQTPNPLIDFAESPFYVNAKLSDWTSPNAPRRAGVTSLGIGGTNAHVILEEAPRADATRSAKPYNLVILSARSQAALERSTDNLARHLREHPDLALADVAFTSQVGRKAFAHRRAVIARDATDAAEALSSRNAKRIVTAVASPSAPRAVFLFSGQGSQYAGMGRGLYEAEPVFRETLDRCAELLQNDLGLDLRSVLFSSENDASAAAEKLSQTWLTQPALFALEYSLARCWVAHGVVPQAMLGHSIGEYVAACLADVMSLDDALALTAARGRLMNEMPAGSMLAVSIAAGELSLNGSLSLAAINQAQQCVVSGPTPEIENLERALTARNVASRRLLTSHAFHSSMMDPILDRFTGRVRQVSLHPPRIPFLSNVTGNWITANEATDPGYWARHLRSTVRFSDCLAEVFREPGGILIEVGPGQVLATLARQHPAKSAPVFSSLRHPNETSPDDGFFLRSVGQVWASGHQIDWSALHSTELPRRIPLPTYPFERQRFWIEPDTNLATGRAVSPSPATEPDDMQRWFQRRGWKRTALPAAALVDSACWLIFLDALGLGEQVAAQLLGASQTVIHVAAGDQYDRRGRDSYVIRPGVPEDYDALIADLERRGTLPKKIVHLWSVGHGPLGSSLDRQLDLSFFSLLYLAQSLGSQDLSGLDIAVVSDDLHSVSGEAISDPARAALLGPTKTIPQELAGISCRNIDLHLEPQGNAQASAQVIAELSAATGESVVAYRGADRWIENFEQLDVRAEAGQARLKQRGIYLITGGVGGIGLVIAEHLARNFQARLILIARTEFPPADQWKNALSSAATSDRLKGQIRKLLDIRSLGAELLVLRADVTRPDEIETAVRTAIEKFGSIDGVIHAAGVIEDAPLLIKTRESAARVLDPKIKGTLALQAALRGIPLDFFVLFSSVSALVPPPGQVDYAGANAFLDAYALTQPNVTAINWGLWRDVGMGTQIAALHPLLDRRLLETADETLDASQLSGERHWVLDEHRLKSGTAVLPGTAYLGMAAAALLRGPVESGIEFSDVFFLSPLSCDPGQTKQVRVRLRRERAEFRFSILSHEAEWTENASGRIARSKKQPPPNQDLEAIAARCQLRVINFDDKDRTRQESYFDFGKRWRNLKTLHLGKLEALADLELPPEFARDTSVYRVHPALLDLATGAALYLIAGYERASVLYLPLSYKKINVYGSLPPSFHSFIRSRQENTTQREVASFDITLLADDGRVLAEIEDFSMRRIADPARIPIRAARSRIAGPSPLDGVTPAGEPAGIDSIDGAKAFLRILSAPVPANVVVFPDHLINTASNLGPDIKPHAEHSTSKDEVETVLAGWWQELLGVENLGLDDDFFDLGGYSLIAVRLFSKIKKTYRLDLGLSTLFEARTIRHLAKLIRQVGTPGQAKPSQWSALVPIRTQGERPPLFVISGLGGNVLNFSNLAAYLGEDQPVYALQPQGLDGKKPFLTRIEDMAAYYIQEIRKLQPEGPYYLAGYSFGGFVAFEMAQQLLAQDEKIGLLGLLDTIEWHYLEQIKRSLRLRERVALYKARIDHIFFEDNGWDYFKRRLEAESSKLTYRLFKLFGRALPQKVGTIEDVNRFAASVYQAKVYPGTLTIFRSTTREPLDGNDELLGWGGLAAGGLEVRDVPGTHHDITREPNVQVLAELLRQCLDREGAQAQDEEGVRVS